MIVESLATLTMITLAPVELHGGMVVDEPIVDVTMQGVAVGSAEEPSWISWDRIASVTGEDGRDAREYMSLADDLWRARIRLARGDVVLAEGIFEELFELYLGTSGASALVVAEGRLRCALNQGFQADALVPWLEVVRLRGQGERLAGEPPLPSILDETTSLLPALPPFLIGEGDDNVLASLEAMSDTRTLSGSFASLYLAILGERASEIDSQWADHPGVLLLLDCREALHAQGATRHRARDALRERIEDNPDTWIEAWCRVALAESLVREGESEQDEERTIEGVLEMLHLPARFERTQVFLAGYALARVSQLLDGLGEHEAGASLARTLLDNHPLHPASEHLRRQSVTRMSQEERE
ncbi:MAG: hypothetical protein ACF8GE_05215 [Phycisphaerales bacterium JB043]